MKRNEKQSLQTFIKESAENTNNMMSYLNEDSINFKQSALSKNLREPLVKILNETCADFLREIIFLNREINF